MGDNYWELTIAVLQDAANPLVDKPKLSEKYLTKPPFRFLHDVITGVQAKTGFAPGLFQGDELDGKALQDKDAKVVYLTKIINVVSIVLGEAVPAKPLKIVAGLEPENTNVFLQMLGNAAQRGDAAAVVQRVLGGEQFGAAPAAAAAPAAEKSKAKPKPKPKAAAEPAAEAAPPAAAAEEAPAEKPAEKPKKVAKPKAAPAPPPEEAPPPAPEEPEKKKKEKRASASGNKPKAAKEEDAPLPAPAAAAADVEGSAGSASAAAQRSLARPQSARKAPPKLPAQTPAPAPSIAAAAAAAAAPAAAAPARPGTASRRGPDAAAAKPVMLFEEGAKGGDDDDDVEVVHEQRPIAVGAMPEGEQGVLVKNILEAEKALKKTREEGEDEGQTSGGIILKRLGKPAAAAGAVKTSDHAGMREMVQKLTQSSHPLAKSMDYLQEDLENMAKEYRFWVTERRVFQEKLGDEQRMVSDQAAADARLADLEGQVRQVRDRTLGMKAQILRNDETIAKLLAMAVSGGR